MEMTENKCALCSVTSFIWMHTVWKRYVPQGKSWVQKQKFVVIVSGRVIEQAHVTRGTAVVVRRRITFIRDSMMRIHPYNTVRHEQVQVHQISHLFGHYKSARCRASITQMQLFTRQYIAGQVYKGGHGKYTRNAENKKIHPCKGDQQCVFRH